MTNHTTTPLLLIVSMLASAPVASAQWTNSLKPTGDPGPELTLATDGRTDYRIVVPIKPTTQDAKAADELARWLKKMTSAEFPVVEETQDFTPSDREISVGRTMLRQAAQLPENEADLSDEGYAIAIRGKTLFLFGGERRGAIVAEESLTVCNPNCGHTLVADEDASAGYTARFGNTYFNTDFAVNWILPQELHNNGVTYMLRVRVRLDTRRATAVSASVPACGT